MTAASSAGLRERLEWLMVFRVITITLLLGSAIFIDVGALTGSSYLELGSVIVATYVATIVYAATIRRLRTHVGMAYVQLTGDVLVASVLIYLTGGSDSIFAFILYLHIINAAILLGRQGAFAIATMASLVSVGMLSQALGAFEATAAPIQPRPIYNTALNVVAFYLVGLLAGNLAKRLIDQGTELRRSRLNVEELQALNHNILASIPSSLLTLAEDGEILHVNSAAEALLGSKTSELYGRHLSEVVPSLWELLEPRLNQGGLPHTTWHGWLVLRNERRYVEMVYSPLLNPDGFAYGHTIGLADRTREHELEQQVKRQDRLAATGQFATAIAHEIRNPLASISGSIELLAETVPERDRQLHDIVIREADRLNNLVTDFLAFARPARRRLRTIDLFNLANETLKLAQNGHTECPELVLDGEPIKIRADEEAMRQVLWNLLRNAIEASPNGAGPITVSLKRVTDSEGREYLNLRCTDHGEGIPEDLLESIFEPFVTGKSSGTGLGLATINRIIDDHRGTIQAWNNTQGCTFDLVLPLDPTDAAGRSNELAIKLRKAVQT